MNENGWEWYSPKSAPFRLAGLPWIKQDGVYRRLPVDPGLAIPQAVDELANCTAGAQVQFRTDSSHIGIRVQLQGVAWMHHMAATGEAGVDIYVGEPFAQQSMGAVNFDARASQYEATLITFFDEPKNRNITINLPLYQGVDALEIGIKEGSVLLEPPSYSKLGCIVAYGTSITQGGCATRPGMAYTNILSRLMNQEFVNLGFSGNGKGEPELAQIITTIPDKRCVILDYEANCDTPLYKKTLPRFIQILREAHPVLPIVVVSRIPFAKEIYNKDQHSNWMERFSFQYKLITDLQNDGDRNIHFVNGQQILGDDWTECTVDGVHLTDLGFYRMASFLHEFLRKIGKMDN
jgi:lysophospholipase L1-like esterase